VFVLNGLVVASEAILFFFVLGIAILLVVPLLMATDHAFKVLESNHHDRYIVKRLPIETVLQDAFHSETAKLVHANGLGVWIIAVCHLICARNFCRVTAEPDALTDVFVSKFVKDAIAAENDEVVMLRNLEDFDFGFRLHDVWVAATVL